jgi:transcriptional regulator NrdR family protein
MSAPAPRQARRNGFLCASCGSDRVHVIDSQFVEFGGREWLRRRRICRECGLRFTTHETRKGEPPGGRHPT